MRRTRLRGVLDLLLLPLLLSCGGEADDAATPASSPAAESAAKAAQSQAWLQVSVKGGRVWLSAREARRSEILLELSTRAPFELLVDKLPAARLTLAVEDAPLEAVLAQLLGGIDFRVEYRFVSDTRAHVVSRVVAWDPEAPLGPTPASLRTHPDSEPASPAVAARAVSRRQLRDRLRRPEEASDEDPEEHLRRAERQAAEEVRTLKLLYSDDARQRATAVENVDLQGAGRDRVYDMLEGDPDPAVRVAAVERLIDEDSQAALDKLYAALQDSSSQVVQAAIEVLEWVGDENALPHLASLAEGHPDFDVRDAANEAFDFLE